MGAQGGRTRRERKGGTHTVGSQRGSTEREHGSQLAANIIDATSATQGGSPRRGHSGGQNGSTRCASSTTEIIGVKPVASLELDIATHPTKDGPVPVQLARLGGWSDSEAYRYHLEQQENAQHLEQVLPQRRQRNSLCFKRGRWNLSGSISFPQSLRETVGGQMVFGPRSPHDLPTHTGPFKSPKLDDFV